VALASGEETTARGGINEADVEVCGGGGGDGGGRMLASGKGNKIE